MTDGQTEPRWPKLLSLTVHEFRSPLTVVSGYLRMLLKDRAGPLSDQQRRLLEEADKSCGRLSGLIAELSELSQLEASTAPFNRNTVDLRALLQAAIAGLPELDRPVSIHLDADSATPLDGDAVRLMAAFTSILNALRRELVTSDQLTVRLRSSGDGKRPCIRITIADPVRMEALQSAGDADFSTFDEWRGGNGLTLPNARRIVEAHHGRLWGPGNDSKAAAIIEFPLA